MKWPGPVKHSEVILSGSSLQWAFYFWSLSCKDEMWQEQLSLLVDSALSSQQLPAHWELRLCGCRGQSQGPSPSHPISSLEQGSIALVDFFLHLDQCLHTLKGNSIFWCPWELWTSCSQRKYISLQLCHGCVTKINNVISFWDRHIVFLTPV